MNEIANLKTEARKLLDELNHTIERSPNGEEISYSPYSFEGQPFRERLSALKEKFTLLQTSLAIQSPNK